MTDLINDDWSQLDSNNTGASPNGVTGGYSPSTIGPIIRAIRGGIKRDYVARTPILTSGGTGNTYTLTFEQAPTSGYKKGLLYSFWADKTNTGSASLNVNSLGAKTIRRHDQTVLSGGEIVSGSVITVVYDGTYFRLQNVNANPQFTGTIGGDDLVISNTATIERVTANIGNFTSLSGNGTGITSLNANNLTSGTIPNDRISGSYDGIATLSGQRIRLSATNDATISSTAHAFQIGPDSGENLIIDGNEIMARSNGVGATVYFEYGANTSTNGGFFKGTTEYWHSTNDGSGSGLDADLLDGLEATRFYRDNASFSSSGNLTVNNSAPTITLQDTSTGSYNGRLKVDVNNLYFQTSTDDVTYSEVFRFELDTKIGYANNSRIVTEAAGKAWDSSRLNGQGASYYVPAARTVTAGNGLIGGGDLTSGITISMGGPLSITNDSPNATSATGHSHALGFTAAEVYTGSDNAYTNYPIGTYLWVYRDSASYVGRGGGSVIYNHGTLAELFTRDSGAGGGTLAGSWRHRGNNGTGSGSYALWQRVS